MAQKLQPLGQVFQAEDEAPERTTSERGLAGNGRRKGKRRRQSGAHVGREFTAVTGRRDSCVRSTWGWRAGGRERMGEDWRRRGCCCVSCDDSGVVVCGGGHAMICGQSGNCTTQSTPLSRGLAPTSFDSGANQKRKPPRLDWSFLAVPRPQRRRALLGGGRERGVC